MELFFNATHLGAPNPEFVAWVDVMGIQSHMARSICSTANFVYKTHIAALEAPPTGIMLYPVMDGFYASCSDITTFQNFLSHVFQKIEVLIVSEVKVHFRFIIRGGVAFGEVYHGKDLKPEASFTLDNEPEYRDKILIGQPMIDAHDMEKLAPPFGISIHPSANAFKPTQDNFSGAWWWYWYKEIADFDCAQMKNKLKEYFDWCGGNIPPALYSRERMELHRFRADRYFT